MSATVTRHPAAGVVPVVRTTFIGREREIAALSDALRRDRLVTIVGPGGAGKTRLAMAVAGQVGAHYPDGSLWVDLSGITPHASLTDAVLRALGLREHAGQDATQRISEALGGLRAVLVLDDCDHVIDAAALLVDHLLGVCDGLAILATSREPLAVAGESVWPLTPLAVPPAEVRRPEEIVGYPAVRLLLDRAAAARPGFALDPDAATAAVRVCRRVDGLPLGIELAAARLRVLSLPQVAEGLDDMFSLLVGNSRSASPRHHSLRSALDWSYELLDDDERILLRRLAVFPDWFGLDGAQALWAMDHPGGSVVLLLARLVDKSFLSVAYEPVHPRYRLLHVVRQYAMQRLESAAEGRLVADVHARHYAALAQELAPLLTGSDQLTHLNRLDAELENLNAAVRHLLKLGPTATALGMAGALWRFCYLRGHYRLGREWLDAAATAGGVDGEPRQIKRARSTVLHGAGVLAFLQCDYTSAVRRLEASLSISREVEDHSGIAASLQMLGGVAREQGRYVRAEELYQESLARFEADGDAWGIAKSHDYLAFVAWLRLDLSAARDLADRALREFRMLGDHEGIVWALINLGACELYGGGTDSESLAEAAELARLVDYREGIAWTDHLRGVLAARRGDPAAEQQLLDALAEHRNLGDQWRSASVLADLATVALTAHDATHAAALLGAADAIWEAIGSAAAPCERPIHDATRAAARRVLGDDGYAKAWNDGRSTPLDRLAVPATEAQPGPQRPAQAGRRRKRMAAPEAVRLEVRTLGATRVRIAEHALSPGDWGYAKPRELFFLIATSGPLSKERIGVQLWPDLDAAQLRNALHTALREVRRALGDSGWVVFAEGRYALDRTRPQTVDVIEFEQALATARANREPAAALPHLQRAIALYRGDFLDDVSTGAWAVSRRDGLRRAFEAALLAAGRALVSAGRCEDAVELFQQAVEHDSLLEVAHRELMAAWAGAGEPARAVRHYEQLVALLREELGVAPADETRALYENLTRHS